MSPQRTYLGGCVTILSIVLFISFFFSLAVGDCVRGQAMCWNDGRLPLTIAVIALIAGNALMWIALTKVGAPHDD